MVSFKIATALLGLTGIMSLGHMPTNSTKLVEQPQLSPTESYLYEEDFSNNNHASEWSGISFVNGQGVFDGSTTWVNAPLPATAQVQSNNYSLEYDMKKPGTGDLFFHFVGLDGRADDHNIYLHFINDGQYLRLATYNDEGDVYDNSGEDQGSQYLNIAGKLATQIVHFKFVVFNDVIDCYADNVKFITTSLSRFGNNRYHVGRSNVTKGILKGFAWDYRGPSEGLILDNIKLKEAVAESTDYIYDGKLSGPSFTAPLGATNLYQPNYRAEATFEVGRSLVENGNLHGYPKLQLCAIHPTAVAAGGKDPSNNIVAQTYLDREFGTPWVGMMKPNFEWATLGLEGYTSGDFSTTVLHTFIVEVFDGNIRTTFKSNGASSTTKVATGKFSDLGVTDLGEVFSVRIENEYTDCIHLEYHGHEESSVIEVKVNDDIVAKNEEVTASAYLFGGASEWTNNFWYVDGVKSTVQDLEHNFSFDTDGIHTLKYGNDQHMSKELEIDVGNKLDIKSDKTEVYAGESVNFTVKKTGTFTNDVKWFVNDVEKGTGDTFTTNEFVYGETYNIQAKCDEIVSNVVSISVKAPEIIISSTKGSYLTTESAEVTARFKGFAETPNLEWYINETKNPSLTGSQVSIPLNVYPSGVELHVQAKAGTFISNDLVISILFDVKTNVLGSDDCQVVYEQTLGNGSEANFGGYALTQSSEGLYYKPTSSNGNDAEFPAFNVDSLQWAMEYDFLVPQNISNEFYIYPQLHGMDTRFPTDSIEAAMAVNNSGIRTYLKFHTRNEILEQSDFGTGVNLTYDSGNVNRGWNHCLFAVDGNYASFYINDIMVFFANVKNITIPSGVCMSMFFGGSSTYNDAGFKNFKVSAIREPVPDVTGVSISASRISCKVGESVTLTANLTPWNAVANHVEWYVNGALLTGETLTTLVFTPESEGEYSIVCKVDGISSSAKKITVTSATGGGGEGGSSSESKQEPTEQKLGCGGSIATSGIATAIALAGIVILKKKKEN